ncbi:Lsr2 family DNA-binding protein [Curtobacterium sp. MCBA15_005]|uniref:Lsr2 family DNA-binding protein n=1 Tax=Curtobacterium sp. MCBA15_005 TaxID=1898734 RepID=UPI000B335BF6
MRLGASAYMAHAPRDARSVLRLRRRRPKGQRLLWWRRRRQGAKRGNSDELAKTREWADANGHEVSSRGRISHAVRDPYESAH